MTQSGKGPADSLWLTPAEVSSVLRVSRMTIYRLIHDETLAAIRVGRSFRIPAQALRHLEGHY